VLQEVVDFARGVALLLVADVLLDPLLVPKLTTP
jgi:hypothetical protein